ncbi:MAG TPA: pyridoxal-dependent decarboxylase [Acidimicrobiia bacterium]
MHHFDDTTEDLARRVFEYTAERLHLDPVPLDHGVSPSRLDADAPSLIDEHGHSPAEVMDQFVNVLAPAVISSDSPRFLSFIPAAPTKASLLFDMVVSCSSLSGISWLEAAGAVHAENQVLRFLADLAGLPEGAGGCFVSGGSAANLSALVTARDTARRARGRVGGAAPGRRGRIAASEQAHSSVKNTANIIDADILAVPTGADDRLTGGALRAALERDPDPESVFAIVATGGTTNAGIVDDLRGVGDVARDRGIWFHADCAYGGAALLAPSVRTRFDGIELVDSFVVDPHKFLFAPFDSAALLYRTPELARAVHTQDASYLDVIHDREEWNPTDYAYHLTRRARGLPLWCSLAVHGWGAYRDAIEQVLATTRAAAARIDAAPHVELVREPELTVVLFRRLGWDDARYEQWSAQLLADQIAFVTPSKWRGATVARLAFLHPDTPIELVDEILASME